MIEGYERTVGKRGQVTIPKDLRRRLELNEGDEVTIIETESGVLIMPPVDKRELAAGYQARRERSIGLTKELEPTTAEANERLGDVPDWKQPE